LYALVNEMATAGKPVMIAATDLQAVIGMSDSLLVMCEGRPVREWMHGEASEEDVMISAAEEYSEGA